MTQADSPQVPASPAAGPAASQSPPPTAPPASAASTTIQYDDFAKVQLRVGTVTQAEPVPKSKKLMRLQVDLGNETRQILAGIKEHYTPETLVGRQIVVVVNLAPREVIKGEVSNGMLLAASDATGKLCVVSPSDAIAAGATVR